MRYLGAIVGEFIGLKPKMYSIQLAHYDGDDNTVGKRTAKGIPENFKKKHLLHRKYVECIQSEFPMEATFHSLQRKNLEINLILEHKRSLNYFNDKKYVIGISEANHSFGFNP